MKALQNRIYGAVSGVLMGQGACWLLETNAIIGGAMITCGLLAFRFLWAGGTEPFTK